MKNRQRSLFIISVTAASLLFASPSIFAHAKENYKGVYKDQVPCPTLNDGFYVGLAAGYDSYRIAQDTFINLSELDPDLALGDSVSREHVLNATGAVGGSFLGYGKYFSQMYNTYLGLEVFGNWSGAQTETKDRFTNTLGSSVTKDKINVKNNYGISVLPGVKLFNTALLYVRLGYNWSKIEVKETFKNDDGDVASFNETNTPGGFNYGLGIEAGFMDNWSVRAEYTHTDYNDFDTDLGTEITPADNQFMFGVIYHFNI